MLSVEVPHSKNTEKKRSALQAVAIAVAEPLPGMLTTLGSMTSLTKRKKEHIRTLGKGFKSKKTVRI